MPIRRLTTNLARLRIATVRRGEVHRPADGDDRPTRPADRSGTQAAAALTTTLLCAAAVTISPFTAAVAAPAASKSASPSATAPSVRCELHYGGETFTVDATPTTDPYRVPAHEIGSYFLFKLVWHDPAATVARATRAAHSGTPVSAAAALRGQVHAYTYADLPQGPTLLHQHSSPAAALRAGQPAAIAWQRVHEPMRDGELLYRCRLASSAADAAVPLRPAPPVPVSTSPVVPPRIQLTGDQPVVKLTFVGDLMLDDGPGRLIARGGDPLAPFAAILAQADVAIGNLETPIAGPSTGKPLDSKIYTFRSSPEVMRVLKGRFHALAVANNHSGDYGHPAFLETLAHLHTAGIHAFGGGEHLAQAHAPLWIEKAGAGPDGSTLKIAILAYNEFKPRSFEAGPHWPGIAWSEDDQVVADIHAARRAGAHVVIPFMHWGWERELTPGPRQRALARRMIEAGADAIVGGHPHVTQGSSVIRGKPVIWSLGNFVFDGFEELPAAQVGWLLEMEIDRRGVRRWQTVEARMDGDGTPHPVAGAVTPSGVR